MAFSNEQLEKLRQHLGAFGHISALEALGRSNPGLVAKLQNGDSSALDDFENLNKEKSAAIEKQMKQFHRMNANPAGPRVRNAALDNASQQGRVTPLTPDKAPRAHRGLAADRKSRRDSWLEATAKTRDLLNGKR